MAIDVVPLNATVEPREGRARRKEQPAPKRTVRIGEWKPRSIICSRCGMPPSRAKANIMRELEVCRVSVSSAIVRECHEGWGTNQAEKTAMPDTKHYQDHQYQSTSFTACINQDFQHW